LRCFLLHQQFQENQIYRCYIRLSICSRT
jgi:hypothetical protein